MLDAVLQRPEPCDHLVQAYTSDHFLAEVVADYIGIGLKRAEAAVIIATAAHVEAFSSALRVLGIDVTAQVERRRLLFLDAEQTLAKFMVDGRPDRTSFLRIVATALEYVRASAGTGIRLYGEMVDLLWSENVEATIQLEELWNSVLADQRLSLLCAYRMDPLDGAVKGVLRQVTRCHSHFVAVEDYERFEQAVDKAYTDVFGIGGDVAVLRDLMVSRSGLSTKMPAAHAAVFALETMAPIISSEIRARARDQYRAGSRSRSRSS